MDQKQTNKEFRPARDYIKHLAKMIYEIERAEELNQDKQMPLVDIELTQGKAWCLEQENNMNFHIIERDGAKSEIDLLRNPKHIETLHLLDYLIYKNIPDKLQEWEAIKKAFNLELVEP